MPQPPEMGGEMQPPPNMGDGMQPPGMGGGMGMPPGMQNQTQETADYGNLYLSLIIIGIGLFTAIIFRRKA